MDQKQIAAASEAILAFWRTAGPAAWYRADPDFDADIAARFGALWDAAHAGKLADWPSSPERALSFLILVDQFPRNMFRHDPRSFATDELAVGVARSAIDRSWDLRIAEPERQFFYLPFMHSERLADQDHCIRLMQERLSGGSNLLHARAHREIIRRFHRFPYRNDALGRTTTPAEKAFLDAGGYGHVLRELEGGGG